MNLFYGHRRYAEMVPNAPALAIDRLTVGYPGSSQPALREASLILPPGVRAALIGPNGSGKSTLLKAVAGLLPPRSGTILIYGRPPSACHHRVAYLPQRGDVDWRFPVTVERMVLAGRYVHLGWLRRPGAEDRERVQAVLLKLGLEQCARRQISQLSGGQQQRALLARALVQEADLLLLDEPLSAVDAASRRIIDEALDELRNQGKTILMATHHLERIDEEFDLAFALDDGVLRPVARQLPTLEGV
ncbi:MAG: ABC transporter ATP-binding protein [Oscillochloridaceae bacterium]|nr:ABC transporter ATP-binding protein [Chloroflexaceae bacterium]MDW8390393.1 ABC transporter ATP-binding protein [Oscillochloridaceae bacterium]